MTPKELETHIKEKHGAEKLDRAVMAATMQAIQSYNPTNEDLSSAHLHWPRRNVSWSVRRQCLADFSYAMRDENLLFQVCAICGQQGSPGEKLAVVELAVTKEPNDYGVYNVLSIERFLQTNRQLLPPAVAWFQQQARHTYGLVLHPHGVLDRHNRSFLQCTECRKSLNAKTKVPKPPKQSLANNLWFGQLPLQQFGIPALTVPEQLLISRHHVMSCIIELQRSDLGEGSIVRQNGVNYLK